VSRTDPVAKTEARSGFRYPLAMNSIDSAEIEAAIGVLRSGRLTMGEKVRRFEESFASWTGSRFAVMVNSGSSANLLMVEAMVRGHAHPRRWTPGDEVLVPALAWPTTVWPLGQAGLVPVFVDVDPSTLAIDLSSAREGLSPRTRGMFLIHVLGQAADMESILSFCSEHELDLLEDSCESLGACSGGRHVGTLGVMGSFSLYFSHHMTTIEGGVIVTQDEQLADDLRSMRAHGWSRDRLDAAGWSARYPELDSRFLFVTTGFNVRPTELQAAVGLVQLAGLEQTLAVRDQIARRVATVVDGNSSLRLVGAEHLAEPVHENRPWRRHSWMALAFLLRDRDKLSRRDVTTILERDGIETRPIIAGNLVAHPATQQIDYRVVPSLTNADRVLSHGFMVGCNPRLSEESINALMEAIGTLG
jgi:CDP-4-dehydro-6-deoxyglucose reductase, E1